MTFALFLGQALLGWLIADLFSGVFHWWEDRVGRVDWPVLGPWVVAPNRRHHVTPLSFTESGFVYRNTALWTATALITTLWLVLLGPSVTWAFATAGGLMVNEVHRAAHRPKDYGALTHVLQDIGVIQSPVQHARHHRAPSDRAYCVLTDWLNPALDQLCVWDRIERLMTVLGLEPNRGTA